MSRAVVAIAGQPNSGKTTLFNRLTGANAKVANYPGITVERREAGMDLPGGRHAVLLDIPGTYSLSARTAEEQIAISAIAGLNPYVEPDAVIVVVDSTQLARNLYLALQVLELRLPAVIALNMHDIVRKARMRIDTDALSAALGGVPVVPVSASRGEGLEELRRAVTSVLKRDKPPPAPPSASLDGAALDADLAAIEPAVPRGWGRGDPQRRRALALWALLSIDAEDELWSVPDELRRAVHERQRLAAGAGRDIDLDVVAARYRWIDEQMSRVVSHVPPTLRRATDAIDRILIHPLSGFVLFLLLMAVVFESLFTWSTPMIDGVTAVFAAMGDGLRQALPPGLLNEFIVDGLIAGVGTVLAFLPQILMLFLFISLMEDSGYMARAAFLMDRVMRAIGLTGRAFVPMLSGFACAIPAIMATRTMERRRDRMLTMMVIPIMTCSARLPVYTLIIGALFPARDEPGGKLAGVFGTQALLMVGMYAFSTLLALLAAVVLGRTIFRGPQAPLLLELPPYRMPQPRSVLRMMWERGRLFVTEAGSVILVCSIILWVLLSFPREVPAPEASAGGAEPGNWTLRSDPGEDEPAAAPVPYAPSQQGIAESSVSRSGSSDPGDARRTSTEVSQPRPHLPATGGTPPRLSVSDGFGAGQASQNGLDVEGGAGRSAARARAERMRNSFGGRLGRLIEPAIAPLGFDWKIGVGLIGSFAAREVFVSTMGVVYGLGESDEGSGPLRSRLHEERWPDGRRVYTPLVGLSLMVFFALAAQCMSTLAVIRRETRSWRWPAFLFTYMTVLAWVASFAVYQGGRALGLE